MDIGTAEEWLAVAKDESDDCIALFYMRAVESKYQSKIEGRPIFASKPYVKILIPGQKNAVVDRPAKDADKTRFAKAWERFQANQDESTLEGTPIREWPYLTVSRVAELNALNIHTVEQLVNVADGLLGKLGSDGRELQKRAKQYLQGDSDTETELRAENAELKSKVQSLEARLADKPKRGRPRKHKEGEDHADSGEGQERASFSVHGEGAQQGA